jgi:hypothetical protein
MYNSQSGKRVGFRSLAGLGHRTTTVSKAVQRMWFLARGIEAWHGSGWDCGPWKVARSVAYAGRLRPTVEELYLPAPNARQKPRRTTSVGTAWPSCEPRRSCSPACFHGCPRPSSSRMSNCGLPATILSDSRKPVVFVGESATCESQIAGGNVRSGYAGELN